MITLRRTTLGRTPLDEWSAWRRDLYLTTHNTHNRQTSMPPPRVGFEPAISSKRAAAVPRLRLHGHRDRHKIFYSKTIFTSAFRIGRTVTTRNASSASSCAASSPKQKLISPSLSNWQPVIACCVTSAHLHKQTCNFSAALRGIQLFSCSAVASSC